MAVPGSAKSHFRYIDCVRGYAILMVIVSHATYQFPNLPWPVRRLTETGWFGVQLFFLASAVTLLFSWHGAAGGGDARAFFIRRFFRIAPAYYLAGVLYYLLAPPAQFDLLQVLRSATFVNAFSPAWLTAPGAWNVVPGGWSISVEFTFYALFPLYAATVTTLRRALIVLAVSLAAGVLANLAALHLLSPHYPAISLGNFLFFWFPNQASVFALGGACYFILRAARPDDSALRRRLAPWSTPLALACAALFCALSLLPLGHFLGDRDLLPAGQLVSLVLAGFVIALSVNRGVLAGRTVALMGQVSFSAYLLHYLALDLVRACPRLFHVAAGGAWAILAFAAGLVVMIAITFAAAWVSYRVVEVPMIGVGRRLCRRLKVRAPLPQLSLP
jgi:peptidoglycan/LPS O-acetylase OafA/YrhL